MKKTLQPVKLLVSVELGNPAAECAHYGICSMEVLPVDQFLNFKPCHKRQVKAVLSKTRNGRLRFEFPPEGMRLDTWLQFFPVEGFRINAPFILPLSSTILLQLEPGTHIVSGIYPWHLSCGNCCLDLDFAFKSETMSTAA